MKNIIQNRFLNLDSFVYNHERFILIDTLIKKVMGGDFILYKKPPEGGIKYI